MKSKKQELFLLQIQLQIHLKENKIDLDIQFDVILIKKIMKSYKFTFIKEIFIQLLIRLNKYISNSGVCSRREADILISDGKIMINNVVTTALGTKVKSDDIVSYNGKVLKAEKNIYILINKPKTVSLQLLDTHDRKTVMDIIDGACSERLYPVGRLDRDTILGF